MSGPTNRNQRRYRRAVAHVRASGILQATDTDFDRLIVFALVALLDKPTVAEVAAAHADPVVFGRARDVLMEAAS